MANLRALADLSKMFLEDKMQRRRQQELSAQGMQQQLVQSMGPLLAKGDLDISNLPAEYQHILAPFASAAPTQDERAGSVATKWGAANNPGDVPTELEGIQQLKANHVNVNVPNGITDPSGRTGFQTNIGPVPNAGRNVSFSSGADGTLPATAKPIDMPDPVREALATRQGISDRLTTQRDATNVTDLNFMDKSGIQQHMVVPTSQAASYGALPQERTGAQEGQRVLDTAKSGTLSPGYVVADAEAKNQLNRLTLPADTTRAGRLAGATESAQQNAYMAPNLVNARVDEANAKVRGAAQYGAPTDTELSKAQFIAPMIAADGKAREIEKDGVGFRTGLLQTAQSPMLSNMDSMMGHFTNDERQYAQAAIDYSNNFAQLKSGVTVREDEFPRYLYNLFAVDTDTPEVRKQKAATRAAFNASVQISLGKGKYEGGLAIGRAIRQGTITPAALGVMSLDPEVLRGINDIGSGAHQ